MKIANASWNVSRPNQELLFAGLAVNWEQPRVVAQFGRIHCSGVILWDFSPEGWSRPSYTAVSHGPCAPEVPQRLRPDRNTAFNAALKRCSPQHRGAQKAQFQEISMQPPISILFSPVWGGRPREKSPAVPSPCLRQSPILPAEPPTHDGPWWAGAYVR
jgi:hypothetical protein